MATKTIRIGIRPKPVKPTGDPYQFDTQMPPGGQPKPQQYRPIQRRAKKQRVKAYG